MGRKIVVNPAELNSTAGRIDNMSAEYRKLFNKLFSDVNSMQAAWQGADNQAFSSQIQGFQDDFTLMAKLMDEYSQFLKTAAKTYQQAQDDTIAAARKLSN